MQSLLKNCDIREVGAPIANASNTDSNSDILDMAGYDGVTFICPIEDCADTGVATLTIEQDALNADTSMAAVVGGAATKTSAANDDLNNKLLVAEIYRPLKRYVQAVRVSATANIAFGTLIAILWRGSKCPVAEHSTILDAVNVASPAES